MNTNISVTKTNHPNPLLGGFGRHGAIENSERTPPSARRRRQYMGRACAPSASAWLRLRSVCVALLGGFLCLGPIATGQPAGLRVGNSTLRLPANPPPTGYTTTNAFGTLSFLNPLSMTAPPGETNRLFIVEQRGRISVITNLAAPTRTVFLDITARVTGGVPEDEQGMLGVAFHPNYATNRFFYLYYSTTRKTAAGSELHHRLSRFEASPSNPSEAMAASELPLLSMFDEAENHNGGDLHFGADGYLYVSLGDEGIANDQLNNSQIINKDFWSGILRLDVDNRSENLAPNPHRAITPDTYRVPSDNPFVGITNWNGKTLNPATVRTEFYAVGLRNPWRMSFDPVTGFLYCGDVGQDAREEIDIIIKGGNYGWAFREGLISGPKASPPGADHINPILDYAHGFSAIQGNSVTGGVVYRGRRIPALFGRYIFADYVSGNIWSILYDGTNATPAVRLAVDANIAGFGVDPSNGDVLMADQGQDQIKRLVAAPPSDDAFPPSLADTGAFIDLDSLTPQAGLVPYDINLPFWSDNAIKTRWFYIPTNRTIAFRATSNWSFPPGSVWVKHFELELTNGAASSRRRLETRFIVRDSRTNVYGVTYRWDDEQTNATLVPEEGLDETFIIDNGGIPRTQVWHYPGRSECLHCHTGHGGQALGFNTPQMNRDFDYGGIVDNQIRAMANAGYFGTAVPNLHALRWLAHPTNETVSVEQRVRSYLTANCVGCHQPDATGGNSFDTRLISPLSVTRLINGVLNNHSGDPANRVIVPGDPAHSMLLERIATRGPRQMPPLDSTLVDPQAVALISRWITNDLVTYRTFAQWQIGHFGSVNAPNALALADPDGDGANNYQEYLAYTNPNLAADAWGLRIETGGSTVRVLYPRLVNRRIEVQWTSDLTGGLVWQFLNVPQNQPFISATNGLTAVLDSLNEAPARYYRARVFEP